MRIFLPRPAKFGPRPATPITTHLLSSISYLPSPVRGHAKQGFTLIELVISASLMALILVSGYLCLSSAVASQKLIESRAEVVQSARVAMSIISADLRAACPLSKDISFLGMDRMVEDSEADNLDFGTHNYKMRRAGESDFCEVSYFLNREPDSETFSLWRRRDPSPDEEPLAGGSGEEIARGVSGLMFEYYDGYEWFDDWGDLEGRRKGVENAWLEHPNWFGMPEAVRITLWIDPHPRQAGQARPEPGRRASTANDTADPPMVFRTVARLNLAAISQEEAAGPSINTGSGQTTQPAPNPGNP